MFSHVMIGTNDLERARAFYDALLATIGVRPGAKDRQRYFWRHAGGIFGVSVPIDGEPACHGNGATLGFAMATPEQADAWHAAGIAAGGTPCEDPPGWRTSPSGARMYLAYLRDPDGNKLCGLHRPPAA